MKDEQLRELLFRKGIIDLSEFDRDTDEKDMPLVISEESIAKAQNYLNEVAIHIQDLRKKYNSDDQESEFIKKQ